MLKKLFVSMIIASMLTLTGCGCRYAKKDGKACCAEHSKKDGKKCGAEKGK